MMRRHIEKIGLALALLLLVASAGCVSNPDADYLGPGEMAIERKAQDCYEHAVAYMGKGHYLLARQQFSEAAAMAMSQQLHDDALAGMNRVDKIIAEGR